MVFPRMSEHFATYQKTLANDKPYRNACTRTHLDQNLAKPNDGYV